MLTGSEFRSVLTPLLCGMCLALASGCGRPLPPATDETSAADALDLVLDAWQSGETPEALAEMTPRVHVKDDDWNSGWKLTAYELTGPNSQFGLSLHCPATLSLQSPEGDSVKKSVLYVVATEPIVSVVRHDEEATN